MSALQLAYGKQDTDPASYYLDSKNPLNDAIRVALQLGKPLLLTGDPGTGKTQLAHYAAWLLHNDQYSDIKLKTPKPQTERQHPVPFREKPFVFHTKTYSSGKDLFYYYDAISHFRDKDQSVQNFIQLTALGQAITQTWGSDAMTASAEGTGLHQLGGVKNAASLLPGPHSSVVLIDEIDKAPRDFPNDLLNEIEAYEYYITEMNATIKRQDNEARILLIMTSNAEKTLPDAFLRRCIFYHIPTPGKEELVDILKSRLSFYTASTNKDQLAELYRSAVDFFLKATKPASLNKPPATGELIDWIKVLHLQNVFNGSIDFSDTAKLIAQHGPALKISLHALFKTSSDLESFKKTIDLK